MPRDVKTQIRLEDMGAPVQELVKRLGGVEKISESDMAMLSSISVKMLTKVYNALARDADPWKLIEDMRVAQGGTAKARTWDDKGKALCEARAPAESTAKAAAPPKYGADVDALCKNRQAAEAAASGRNAVEVACEKLRQNASSAANWAELAAALGPSGQLPQSNPLGTLRRWDALAKAVEFDSTDRYWAALSDALLGNGPGTSAMVKGTRVHALQAAEKSVAGGADVAGWCRLSRCLTQKEFFGEGAASAVTSAKGKSAAADGGAAKASAAAAIDDAVAAAARLKRLSPEAEVKDKATGKVVRVTALGCADRALAADAKHFPSWAALGEHLALGGGKGGKADAGGCVQPGEHTVAGTAYEGTAAFVKALQLAKAAGAEAPAMGELWHGLGDAMMFDEVVDVFGARVVAAEAFSRAVQADPRAMWWADLGAALPGRDVAMHVGDRRMDAVACCIEAITIDEHCCAAWNNLGALIGPTSVKVKGAPVTERDCYIHAVRSRNVDAASWNNLGTNLGEATVAVGGRLVGRRDCFINAVAIDPRDPNGWFNLGSVLGRDSCHVPSAGEVDRLRCFTRAVDCAPADGGLWFALGTMLPGNGCESVVVNGDGVKAHECFAAAAALEESARAWERLAETMRSSRVETVFVGGHRRTADECDDIARDIDPSSGDDA